MLGALPTPIFQALLGVSSLALRILTPEAYWWTCMFCAASESEARRLEIFCRNTSPVENVYR